MENTVETNYGTVTVTDVMVDDGRNGLIYGVDINNENGNLLCEVSGCCTDDLDGDAETIELLIDTYSEL